MPARQVKDILKRELGVTHLRDVFEWIDLENPLGSASLSQVWPLAAVSGCSICNTRVPVVVMDVAIVAMDPACCYFVTSRCTRRSLLDLALPHAGPFPESKRGARTAQLSSTRSSLGKRSSR